MVELESVSVSYRVPGGLLTAVEDASAFFPEGRITALIGPSGCGKTSLLHAISGLIAPASGRILVKGEELKGTRSGSAVIFQDSGLLPWRTVRENAELPLLLRGFGRKERRARVGPILDELGLSDFSAFYPARLSGGMRQRLALARALAQEPDLLLMDEPFSSLDALTRESLQDGLLDLEARHKVTVILVTHSIEEAAYLADSVLFMAGRAPGRIAREIGWSGEKDKSERRAKGNRSSPGYFERCAALRRAFDEAAS